MAEAAGILYGIETVIEGAAALAKGVYDPTLPLKAKLVPVSDVTLPRSHHSVSIVKGRAYIFGGKTTSDKSSETLADNDVHIVILPVSGIEGTDYRRITSGHEAPSPRFGHSAAVVDDQIYIFGGSHDLQGTPVNENGAVWAFDTISNKWSKLLPGPQSAPPSNRLNHSSTATEQPRQPVKRTDKGTLPQQPPDPARADIMPEPEAANTFGTLIVYGGVDGSGRSLDDMFAFDISSRTWSNLPNPPLAREPASSPALAIVGSRLYTYSSGKTHFMDLTKATFNDKAGQGELGMIPLGPWTAIQSESEAENAGPGDRSGAAFIPVTSGQGRNYLLSIGGESLATLEGGPQSEQYEDIWALQLKPEGMTAASFKDAARMAVGAKTRENYWSEVKYYDPDDKLIQEGQANRGIGARRRFASSRGSEVDGSSVLLWGGQDADGKTRGDGLMITVSI